jgi:hypothetical protein
MNRNSVPRLVPNRQARASTKLAACGNGSHETAPEFINKHPPAVHGYHHNLTNFQLVIAFLKRELVAQF